ncbi:hypothetical protein C8Q74DRAFT_1249862 [Fomes fomentarius]|nr:hypothetical protein C8Q74DRAFT_1249862 [Fomes fomentarius]
MLHEITVHIDVEGKPTNIPDCESIIKQSFELRPPGQTTASIFNGVRITLDVRSDRDVSNIWVKFAPSLTMGEARTQQFVSQYLEQHNITAVRAPRVYLAFTSGAFGFIVSEYIDGPMCEFSESNLVAAAVQALLKIPSPSSTPGPVGGGVIEHPFFLDCWSDIWYETVEELQRHVNGILAKTERPGRVNYIKEVADYGLLLCISDIQTTNFMKDGEGRIVAVDFGGYSFLPPSFFALALRRGRGFAHNVSRQIEIPPSPNLVATECASFALVPCGRNDIGEWISLLSLHGCLLPPSHKNTELIGTPVQAPHRGNIWTPPEGTTDQAPHWDIVWG